MAHIPEWCGSCKGRKPKVFCHTENKYLCLICNAMCHKLAHNWEELENGKRS